MKSLDRAIEKKYKRRRKERYKYLKKLFKARDAASKHVGRRVRISVLNEFLKNPPRSSYAEETSGVKLIAMEIVERKGVLKRTKPPSPPAQPQPKPMKRGAI